MTLIALFTMYFLTMSNSKKVWDVIWQIVKFILTLGLSHISKREEKRKNEDSSESSKQ